MWRITNIDHLHLHPAELFTRPWEPIGQQALGLPPRIPSLSSDREQPLEEIVVALQR
jgi:hypothetical protein